MSTDMFCLDGKVAAVIGGGGVLAGEMAMGLAAAGADISIIDFNEEAARSRAAEVSKLGRKGQAYELSLWRQDASGYQRELSRAVVPHSVVPERYYHRGTRTRAEWMDSSPDWVTLRVQATDAFGLPALQVEGAAFAWLARQAILGLPGNLPMATGAQGARVLGCIYPA